MLNQGKISALARFASGFALAAVVLFSTGCSITPYQNVESLEQVGSGAVVLVGEFELSPPFKEGEQSFPLSMITFKDMYEGKLVGGLAEKTSDTKGSGKVFNPKLNELFFIEVPTSKRYLMEANVIKSVSKNGRGMKKIVFPSPIDFGLKSDDRAVYIGTLKVTRDEFNSVTKVEVIDEYDEAQAKFQKKFGKQQKLRKSLMKNG